MNRRGFLGVLAGAVLAPPRRPRAPYVGLFNPRADVARQYALAMEQLSEAYLRPGVEAYARRIESQLMEALQS